MTVDLHIHSTFSDGSETPEKIVSICKEKNLKVAALTDHNTYKGHKDFLSACEKEGIIGIPGIELTSKYDGKEIHVLGYFSPKKDMSEASLLNRTIDTYQKSKKTQLDMTIYNLSEEFPKLSIEGFHEFIKDNKGTINRVHLARYMKANGCVEEIDDAFDEYLYEGSPYMSERTSITVKEAIDAIHEAGGVSVIAHLGEYKFSEESVLAKFIDYCINLGMDGVELLHVHNDTKVQRSIINLTKSKNLFYTVGSDFHGKNKKNQIGEFSFEKIEEDVLSFFEARENETIEELMDL